MPLSHDEALRLARICVGPGVTSVATNEITCLWGGMGRIYRVTVKTNSTSAEDDDDEFVVKFIDHACRSCRLAVSDKQKLIESYENEARFYQLYSQDLRNNHGISLPRSLLIEADSSGVKTTIISLSILENVPLSISPSDKIHLTLEWLATLHAATWQRPYFSHDNDNNDRVQGSFWHYKTRPNAWKTMSSHEWEGRLKRAAKPIDEWLCHQTRLQSWIHGDCKENNVMWDATFKNGRLALCDFQYVGQGCPCKDVAYFLCTSGLVSNDHTTQHDLLVEMYFQALSSKLPAAVAPSSMNAPLVTLAEFNAALELAYCDYMRFLCAYSRVMPMYAQQKERLTERVQRTLERMDGGNDLGSEDAYRKALLDWQ